MTIEQDRGTAAVPVIKRRIREFIASKLLQGDDIDLTDMTPLVTGGVIDSLTSIEVGAFIEEAFHVQMSPDELANPEHMETVEAMAGLVSRKLGIQLSREGPRI
jgi:acyl carrier protein